MKIANNLYIKVTHEDTVWSDIHGKYELIQNSDECAALKLCHRISKSKKLSETIKRDSIKDALRIPFPNFVCDFDNFTSTDSTDSADQTTKQYDTSKVSENIKNMIYFFSEFQFEPNFRFVNTFVHCANSSKNSAKQYVRNYFALTDSPYLNDIENKMKSQEFDALLTNFAEILPTRKINNRFKIYYGSQGTGKTTKAMKESKGNVMVCHSAMLPSDLMEDFKFEDGKATFVPSALQIAMTEGKIIVLDEINLLPFESLRFLQSILDEKPQISYKGRTIEIKTGFKIIGTMNLTVNGSTYSLPEPLVDRCEDIKCYKLTEADLLSAII